MINKSIYIEISIILMFLTGIIQWDIISIQWEYFTSIQVIHIISSILVSIALVIPFVHMHLYKYRKNVLANRRNSTNGMILGITLFLVLISGVYLFFIGNRGGDDIGNYSFMLHLYGSFVLVFFLWYHSSFSKSNKLRRKKASQNKVKLQAVAASIFILVLFFPTLSYSSVSSSGLYLTKDTKFIYSANADGGSVSKIDALTGEKIFEKVLGKDIRTISFNEDESIYGVTNYKQNKITFLNNKNEIIKIINTKNRPYGIIYDKKNKYFFVTIFEDNELLVIEDKNFNIIKTIKTIKTPRGMALTDDGRLLVTHSMTGQISLYDSRTFIKLKTIDLHATQNDDEFIPQGLPRYLDNIRIKPDGSEAWLPHILWNFDHPFQFQSTVFPTVSIISLKKGDEKELEKKRKNLFKEINVLTNTNSTMIVSNPFDLAFSADGSKVFVTLSGSEDVMVFNIGRSSGRKNKRLHRKRGKRSGNGAKVTQIFRAYPNNTNPQYILSNPKNDNLFVQNAARLDITLLDSGGSHPFARMTLKKDKFSKLVEKDPLSKELREGKILFNNGNTNTNKSTPMTGDFWMSCNSCHFEGFNFTNGFLFEATKLDKSKKANVGHDRLDGFVSKAPLADYVRFATDAQGGMGHDKKAKLPLVDPKNLSKELENKMKSLHTYVTSRDNLRYLSSWIKLEEDVEQYHVEDWTNSVKCKSCHNDIFNQWADSNHKNLVGTNPYYMVLENIAAKVEGEEFRKWCMSCHSPSAVTTGLAKTTDTMGHLFDKGAQKTLIEEFEKHGNSKLEEGVSCVACHRIRKIEDAGGNASYTLNITQRPKYAFEDSEFGLGQWMSEKLINSKPKKHLDSYMKPVYKDSVYCASCHDEFSPGKGSKIVSTYKEWEKSPFNNPDDPTKNKSCIDCHMTNLENGKYAPLTGRSTDGGKIKKDVKVHYFSGSNHFLSGLKNPIHEDQTIQLLRTSAKLSVDIKNNQLKVGVKNVGAGHHLPTGVADFRELWLDITVKDRNSNVVFQSGKLKEDGDLGKDARPFMKVFGDENGKGVGLLFWKYKKLLSDSRIPAGETRVESYDLPNIKELKYPLTVEVKLNFRVYPQWVTSAVQKAYPQLPNPPVIELEKIIKEFK